MDLSGMVVPSFTWSPWKRFSVSLGNKLVYGPADSEFIVKNSIYDDPSSPATVRFDPYIKLYFGECRF